LEKIPFPAHGPTHGDGLLNSTSYLYPLPPGMPVQLQNTGLKVMYRSRLDRNQPVRFQLQRIEQLGQAPDFLEIIEWRLKQDQQIDITPRFGLAARLGAVTE